MKKLKKLIFWGLVLSFQQLNLSAFSQLFAQNKALVNIRRSACTKKNVVGKLPENINIPQQWCVDEKRAADAREKVLPGNGRNNLPNHTVNGTDMVYGGMEPDNTFNQLPKEVRRLIKLTFPEIAADDKQLYLLTIVAANFPEKGSTAKFVRNYQYSLQSPGVTAAESTPPPKLPTWIFIKQGGRIKLRTLEILTWDVNEKTYK